MTGMGEDDQIRKVGEAVIARPPGAKPIAVLIYDHPGKADRYIRKLEERFPGVTVTECRPGPDDGTILIGLTKATLQ